MTYARKYGLIIQDEEDSDDDKPLIQVIKKAKQNIKETVPEKTKDAPLAPTVKQDVPVKNAPKKVEKKAVIKQEEQVITKAKSAATKAAKQLAPVSSKTDCQKSNSVIKSEPVIKEEKIKIISEDQDEASGVEESDAWWESQELLEQEDDSIKWTSLEHAGVFFPPSYVPHGIPLIYNGTRLVLPAPIEEVATFFAGVIGTPYADNPTFCKNFFQDFREKILHVYDKKLYNLIKALERCDFSLIVDHLNKVKEQRKTRSKEEKEAEKKEKADIMARFGFCILDGKKEKVGNFRVEPPGLFRGRGDHPKTGCLKLRVKPEQITLNLSENAAVPPAPEGHKWGKIVHDPTVTWLACWTENIQNDTKYVFLAAGSKFKGQSDLKKFEKARELAKVVHSIREVNAKELKSDETAIRQRATALWLIDRLALRAGNEKGEDEADTVGCCSLRLEHVSLMSPDTVIFDFLGKDSIRYFNEVQVPEIIFSNLGIFMRHPKKPGDLIFDTLTTSSLNQYLNGLMPGLTAKVFRTYNASFTFEIELKQTPLDGTVAEKVLAYNRANRQVAVLCNHQRTIPKTHAQSMEKLTEKLDLLRYERQLVRNLMKKELTASAIKKRTDDLDETYETGFNPQKMKTLAAIYKQRQIEKWQKLIERQAALDPSLDQRAELEARGDPVNLLESTLEKLNVEKLEKKFASLFEKIQTLSLQLTDKDENKQTALGTSKTNYIDPRISMAWCKKFQVPIDRIFNKSLQEKFKWASTVDNEWTFCH